MSSWGPGGPNPGRSSPLAIPSRAPARPPKSPGRAWRGGRLDCSAFVPAPGEDFGAREFLGSSGGRGGARGGLDFSLTSENTTLPGKEARVRNLCALQECYPARPAEKIVPIISAESGTHGRHSRAFHSGCTAPRGGGGGTQVISAGGVEGPWLDLGLRHPLPSGPGMRGAAGVGPGLTFPGAAVRGFAPLRERAQSVQPGQRGQGRARHSILAQPKSTAAGSTGWERLLCGRPEARRACWPRWCPPTTARPAEVRAHLRGCRGGDVSG